MSPAVGEVVRDLYCGQVPFTDVGPLDVARFSAAEPPLPERNIV
jgi:hypothetical protein